MGTRHAVRRAATILLSVVVCARITEGGRPTNYVALRTVRKGLAREVNALNITEKKATLVRSTGVTMDGILMGSVIRVIPCQDIENTDGERQPWHQKEGCRE